MKIKRNKKLSYYSFMRHKEKLETEKVMEKLLHKIHEVHSYSEKIPWNNDPLFKVFNFMDKRKMKRDASKIDNVIHDDHIQVTEYIAGD